MASSRIASHRLERSKARTPRTSGSDAQSEVLKEQISKLSNDMAQLTSERAALANENNTLKVANSKLQADTVRLQAEVTRLTSLGASSSADDAAELERLREENEALRERVAIARDSKRAGPAKTSKGFRGSTAEALVRRLKPNPALEKKLILASGFDMDSRDYTQPSNSALRDIISQNADVNVNCRSNQGTTPLAYAAWHGDEEAIELLQGAGADLDAENLDGATPLHMCVFNNQPWAAALLLTYGADPFNSGACDDASAMGKPEVQQVFDAWKNELQHPLLAKAEAKIGVVDGEDDGEEGEEGEEGDEEEEEEE